MTPEFTLSQLVAIREALATVIDDGDPGLRRSNGQTGVWFLYDAGDEDFANEQRMRFADAVQSILTGKAVTEYRRERMETI